MRHIIIFVFSCLFSVAKSQTNEQLLQNIINSNDAKEILYTGIRYDDNGDFTKAAICYEKAAKMGQSDAMYNLGQLYLHGEGVPKNQQKAFELVEEAYKCGKPMITGKLGHFYLMGWGCKQDFAKAKALYEEEIKNENYPIDGYLGLALMYAKGQGVNKDYQEALKYVDKAIDKAKNMVNPAVKGKCLATKGVIFSLFNRIEEANNIWDDLVSQNVECLIEDHFYDEVMLYINEFIEYILNNRYAFHMETKGGIDANKIVLIIGNEKYKNVTEVPYATNDSFELYLYYKYLFGINPKRIHYCHDVGLAQLRKEINWVKRSATELDGKAEIVFYYAGHGVPDEKTQTAYLLPVDGVGSNARTGYSLTKLYSELASIPSKQTTVLLDACFSGTKREGDMLTTARGVAIKVKESTPLGNLVILSASQGDETAYPYSEKRHGLFTYYLLNKLQESKGNATLGELSNYIISNVKKTSIVNNGKLQTPTVNTSLDESWKKLTLK